MNATCVLPRLALVVLLAALQACGGGGGRGSGQGPAPAPDTTTRLTVSTTNISVSATPGDDFPREHVGITVSNPPDEALYVGAQYTTNGIADLDFEGTSETQGVLRVFFSSPTSIPNGTYDDSIELHVCTDEACTQDIAGSPVMIRSRYVVSGSRTASIARDSFEFRTDTQQDDWHTEIVQLTIPNPPFGGADIRTETTGNMIASVMVEGVSQTVTNVKLEYLSGRSVRPGIYEDAVTIKVCYDNGSCARQLDGSPFTITSRVVVDTGAEPGIDPLEVISRAELTHDIVDAEYSKALDAVVMVGTHPSNALYVYDVNSGSERMQTLSRAPSAVSVAPDGLSAAVGHDELVTVVDLAQVGQPGAPSPTLLDVTADVIDVVLDGRGRVHAFERIAEWQDIRTIDVATNTEQLSTGRQLYAGALARLHPSGDFLYSADSRNISSDNLNKWDVSASPVAWVAEQPLHTGEYVCSNLWFRENGASIYGACGNTFRSSTDPAQDMIYTGQIDLSGDRDFDYVIRSLSQTDTSSQIALVEAETGGCERTPIEAGRCFTHLAYYESEFLNRQAVFAITPISVGERSYPQRGLFVFHDAAGSRKILLSKLDALGDPDHEYYLSVIQ